MVSSDNMSELDLTQQIVQSVNYVIDDPTVYSSSVNYPLIIFCLPSLEYIELLEVLHEYCR